MEPQRTADRKLLRVGRRPVLGVATLGQERGSDTNRYMYGASKIEILKLYR